MFGGILYAKAMLLGLTTLWRDAVGTSALHYHLTPTTMLVGMFSSVFVSTVTLWLAIRAQARRPAHELLSQGAEFELQTFEEKSANRNWSNRIAIVTGLGAVGLVAWAISQKETGNAGLFFGAGSIDCLCQPLESSGIPGIECRVGQSGLVPCNRHVDLGNPSR